jgi:hypothetical protein
MSLAGNPHLGHRVTEESESGIPTRYLCVWKAFNAQSTKIESTCLIPYEAMATLKRAAAPKRIWSGLSLEAKHSAVLAAFNAKPSGCFRQH